MSRKYIIAAIIILVIPVIAVIAFAENTFLTAGGDSVQVGEKLSFRIDLDKFDSEEFGSYKITIQMSPSEPRLDLDVKENVDINMNKVNGSYSVVSADLQDLKALNFTLKCDPEEDQLIDEPIEYTVSAKVMGEFNTLEEEFSFTVEPVEEEEEEEDEDDEEDFGGGGGGGAIDSDADENAYHGSEDNYLQQLSVSGYEFTQKFHKTRNVYFIDVDDSVTGVQVTAIPCDKGARVDVAGNNNIEMDFSKIVVDVTAANGDVRTYTIYVRH